MPVFQSKRRAGFLRTLSYRNDSLALLCTTDYAFALIPKSIEYLADLPNRSKVGKIGDIPAQYGSDLRDAPVVALPGLKIQISNADIGGRLVTAAGNPLFHVGLNETEWLHVLFDEIHVSGLVVVEIESGSFLIRIHDTDFKHENVSFPAGFYGQRFQICLRKTLPWIDSQ
jgi:hypothetical protein